MKNILFVLFAFLSITANAQNFKIEKITENDFKELHYAKDTAATAVVLYNIGNSYFEPAGDKFQITTIVKTRIKILKKEGFDYATIKTSLYREGNSREMVSVSNANTYNLVNGQVERTRLSSSGEFSEKVEGNHYLHTFTMPNVKEGSIIEFTTKLTSPYFTFIPEWKFQYDIPVVYSEYSVRIPEFLFFYKYIKGAHNVVQSTISDEYFYRASDIPALKDEGYVNNVNNFRSSIIHTFSGYRDQQQSVKLVAGTWEDVVKSINDHDNFGKEIKKGGFLAETALALVEGKQNDEEKADAIFEYVKQNFTSNKNRGIYTTQSLRETFKTKTGAIADINLLTVSLMKNANIKAYPILLSTRSKGIAYMPSQDAFNSVIIGVEYGMKTILYDASDKMSSKDILPIANLNWMGRLVRDNGTSKDVLIEPTIKSRYGITANIKLEKDGSINGTVRKNLNNYEAYVFRASKHQVSQEKLIEEIESRFKIEIEDYQLNNRENISENLEESYSFTRESSFDVIGDKIYLPPMSFFSMKENPFKAESRTYPIDFIYPNDNSYTIYYTIPEGYTVDYVPKSKKVSTASNSVVLKTIVNPTEKRIQIRVNLEYNKAFVEAHEYGEIKQVFEEMVKFCDEKIVLKKI